MHNYLEDLLLAPALEVTLTRKELEAVLKVSGSTIDRLVSANKFPRPVKIGRSCRWRRQDVLRFIEQRV